MAYNEDLYPGEDDVGDCDGDEGGNDTILAQQELEDFEGFEPEGSGASEIY